MINKHDQDREAEDMTDNCVGSDTRSGNTGGDIPNDAASYDPDYDPGASELSDGDAQALADKGLGIRKAKA